MRRLLLGFIVVAGIAGVWVTRTRESSPTLTNLSITSPWAHDTAVSHPFQSWGCTGFGKFRDWYMNFVIGSNHRGYLGITNEFNREVSSNGGGWTVIEGTNLFRFDPEVNSGYVFAAAILHDGREMVFNDPAVIQARCVRTE